MSEGTDSSESDRIRKALDLLIADHDSPDEDPEIGATCKTCTAIAILTLLLEERAKDEKQRAHSSTVRAADS